MSSGSRSIRGTWRGVSRLHLTGKKQDLLIISKDCPPVFVKMNAYRQNAITQETGLV
jgi:hypothetical protein